MANKWLEHLKKFRAANPNIEFAQMAKEAKKTYSPIKKDGEAPAAMAAAPAPSARKTRRGRKGRGTRKSRRHH